MLLRIAGRLVMLLSLCALLGAGGIGALSLVEAATSVVTEVQGAQVTNDDLAARGGVYYLDGTVTPGTSAEEIARAAGPSGTGIWAVVIGIDNYAGSPDLRAGVADAIDMSATLDRLGVPADQRQVLLDETATADAGRAALEWLVANAGPDATALVFFSGHVREVDGDPDADGEAVDEALLFSDGGLLYDGEVRALLEGLQARRTWLAIAACYGAGFDDVLAPGRLLIGAAPEGVLAYESDRYGRTYMVEYVIRRAMLEGQAGGSVQDAFNFAVEQLRRDHPNRVPVMLDQVGEPLVFSNG